MTEGAYQGRQMNNTQFFKFIIIGDEGVGKSCLMLQYIDDTFRLNHQPTIGVEFRVKKFQLHHKKVKLQIWDTAGQESFRSVIRSFYRSARGAIFVYDVTSRDSFNHLPYWLNEVHENSNTAMSCILIGNKCDLEQERQVSEEQGQHFAKQHDMEFVECSAKTPVNIDKIFQQLVSRILNFQHQQSSFEEQNSQNSAIKLLSSSPDKRRCC